MCGNRVDELESRVRELEASVEGLTDELVECKVRLRELENAVDEDVGFSPSGQAETESPGSAGAPESFESPDSAGTEAARTADTNKSEGTDEGDKAEESESSDIIVA